MLYFGDGSAAGVPIDPALDELDILEPMPWSVLFSALAACFAWRLQRRTAPTEMFMSLATSLASLPELSDCITASQSVLSAARAAGTAAESERAIPSIAEAAAIESLLMSDFLLR